MALKFRIVCLIAMLFPVINQASELRQPDTSGTLTRIAFGSCAFQSVPQPIFRQVVASNPDLYISLGDAIYGDYNIETKMTYAVTPESLRREWQVLADNPDWQYLVKNVPVMATWDNHDYGHHSAGAEFPLREESADIFLDFFDEPQVSPRRQRPGIYDAKVFGPRGRRVQIILLDTRSFKSPPLLVERAEGTGGSLGKYAPNHSPEATLLGREQWAWLEQQLAAPAELRLIASSGQIVADQKGMDEWGNYPLERQRLFQLVTSAGAERVLFLTGNVHFSEISIADQGPVPLVDFTSSGLTHVNEIYPEAANPLRVAGPFVDNSFGLVEIDWGSSGVPVLTLSAVDLDGHRAFEYRIESNNVAEPAPENAPPGYQSGYGDAPGFGGPSSVSEQLRENDETRPSIYQFDTLQRNFGPWFDWKRQLNENHGFTLGVNAYWLYQASSGSMTDEDKAFGGIYRLQGSWTAFGRGTDHAGSLAWRIENRSEAFSQLAPQSLGADLGITSLNTGFGYSDNFDTDLAVINWTQHFNSGRSAFAVGRLAFDAYLDAFPFQTFSRGFINRSFLVNPTLATTGIGALGLVAKGFVSSNIWLGGQIYDGNAASGEFDRDTFEEHEWLKSLEIGWTPSIDSRNRERIQFTWWEKDARRMAGVPAGRGWAVSATYQWSEKWQPFVRLGHSDGGAGVAAEDAASIGLEMKPRMDQAWSIGLGWAKPSRKTHGPGLDNETVIETSYKFQLSPNFSLTPDIQYVRNPAKNPGKSSVWVGGVRGILTL